MLFATNNYINNICSLHAQQGSLCSVTTQIKKKLRNAYGMYCKRNC